MIILTDHSDGTVTVRNRALRDALVDHARRVGGTFTLRDHVTGATETLKFKGMAPPRAEDRICA